MRGAKMTVQKDIKIDFEVRFNPRNGKINKSDMKKMAMYLLKEGLLKKDHDYFVTDITGKMTYWGVSGKSMLNPYYNWCVSCEFTEDETETGNDRYNALYFDRSKGGIGENEYESYTV